MPNPHYLDSIYGDSAAMGGFGQGLSNVIVGLQALKYRQQQAALQNAIEQAYLGLARQKQGMEQQKMQQEAPLIEAEIGAQRGSGAHQAAAAALLQQQMDASRRLGLARRGPFMIQDMAPTMANAQQLMKGDEAQAMGELQGLGFITPPRPYAPPKDIHVKPGEGIYDPNTGKTDIPIPGPVNPAKEKFHQQIAIEVMKERIKAMTAGGSPNQIQQRLDTIDAQAKALMGEGGATQQPQSGGMVEVTNPQGKRVRIRQEQLQDALSQGYSR